MDDYTELKSDLEEHCGRLGVLAVNAIEEQAAEIDRLQARVAALETALQTAIDTTYSSTLFDEWRALLAARNTLEKPHG